MGFTFQQTAGGDAPEVKDGVYRASFDSMDKEEHPDWAGTDKFGHPDNGDRIRFAFTLKDKDGSILYDEGDPIVVDALTRVSFGPKSNAYAILKGILTPAELAVVDAKQPFEITPVLGRDVLVQVGHSTKDWPTIVAVLPGIG